MKRFFVFFVFLFFLASGAGLFLKSYLDQKIHLESPVIFEIKKGAGVKKIAFDLAQNKIIQYPSLFSGIFQILRRDSQLKYGEYELRPEDSYKTVIEKLTSGKNYQYQITFIEGDHQYKYADQLKKKGLVPSKEFLKWTEDQKFIKKLFLELSPGFWIKESSPFPSSLEGYLFPDTYFFSKNDGTRTIIKAMVRRFFEKTKDLDFNRSKLSPHQVVILASIVEKETGMDFERPLISSVFHNRLRKKMKLQTDPTILYGILKKTGKETNNIRKKDILAPTEYNTYVIKGLPPGPISNPGVEAIKATLKPEKSDKIYFVSKNDGTHVFSRNYKDHMKAVWKYQKNLKMRRKKVSK